MGFPPIAVMRKFEEYNNADGDNPRARQEWIDPSDDMIVEPDAGITNVGYSNWAAGAIAAIVDEILSKLVIGDPTCGTVS